MKKLDYLLPVSFIVVLLLGLIFHFTTIDRKFSEMENRQLETVKLSPTLNEVASGDWFKQVEKYTSDQFPVRDWWMANYVKLQKAMGKTYIKNYYIDKEDGWIVLRAEPKRDEQLLDDFVSDFKTMQAGLEEMGIPVAFYTFPSKATYIREPEPSYMPEDEGVYNNLILHEKLTAAGIDNTILKQLIDASPLDMYFKTDHHWNIYGAYQGYEALITKMSEKMGETIQPVSFEEENMSCLSNEFAGSWNKILYMTIENDEQICYNNPASFESQFTIYLGDIEENNTITFNEIYGKAKTFSKDELVNYATGYTYDYGKVNIVNEDYVSDKHVVVIKDSYFNSIQFHVASHFQQLTVIDLRYMEEDIMTYLAELDPDYVFFAYNDRNFNVLEKR